VGTAHGNIGQILPIGLIIEGQFTQIFVNLLCVLFLENAGILSLFVLPAVVPVFGYLVDEEKA